MLLQWVYGALALLVLEVGIAVITIAIRDARREAEQRVDDLYDEMLKAAAEAELPSALEVAAGSARAMHGDNGIPPRWPPLDEDEVRALRNN